jgi:hypothetical protein
MSGVDELHQEYINMKGGANKRMSSQVSMFLNRVAEPEPHQNFNPEPEPHENDAAPQHCF